MKKQITLKLTIDYTGNLGEAKDAIRKSAMHLNGMCVSVRGDESYSYKVVNSELI